MSEYTEAELREWANLRVAGTPKVLSMTWQERRDAAELAYQDLKASPERCAMSRAMGRAFKRVANDALGVAWQLAAK